MLRHYLVQDYPFCDDFVALKGAGGGLRAVAAVQVGVRRCPGSLHLGRKRLLPRLLRGTGRPRSGALWPRADGGHPRLRRLDAPVFGHPFLPCRCCGAAGGRVAVLRLGGPGSWPAAPKHTEWIRLHNNPANNGSVAWPREEFDAVEPADAVTRARVAATFKEAVRLERAFFDSAMAAADGLAGTVPVRRPAARRPRA